MPSLDSPALTLGALYLVGQEERGREFTGGESGRGLLAAGFAGSSSEYAANQIRNAVGVDSTSVSDELMQALVGAGISRFGDPIPMNNAMARGIHTNVAIQAFQDAGLSLGNIAGGDLLGGDGGGSQSVRQVNTDSFHGNGAPAGNGGGDVEVF